MSDESLDEKIIYQGDSTRWFENPTMTPAQLTVCALKSAEEIRLRYDSGQAFFTKELLRQVSVQLEKAPQPGQKIYIMGLDGKRVPFEIETGRTSDHGSDSRLEFVVGEPYIEYISVQELVNHDRRPLANCYTPRIAFCNQVLHHKQYLRYKNTKEPIKRYTYTRELYNQVTMNLRDSQLTWLTTKAYNGIKKVLTYSYPYLEVRQIVCFALGSMEGEMSAPWIRRSHLQHALALWLRDSLRRQQNASIACWLQDPDYTDIDKAVLLDNDVHVIDNPHGFLKLDDHTLVLSFGAEVPVHQIVSAVAKPITLIWETFEYTREEDVMKSIRLDQDCPRLRQLYAESYDMFKIEDDSGCFRNIAAYVRRSEDPTS